MKRNAFAVKMISFIVAVTFLWSNVVWAGGLSINQQAPANNTLASSTCLPAIYKDAAIDLIALNTLHTLSTGDMADIKVFYQKLLEKELRDKAGNVRCFGIRDINGRKGKWAFYVVDMDKNEYIRYINFPDVSDRLFDILGTIEKPELIKSNIYKVYKRNYGKEIYRVTDKTKPFIETCLNRLYAYPAKSSSVLQTEIYEFTRGLDKKSVKDQIRILWDLRRLYFENGTDMDSRNVILEVIFKILAERKNEDSWKNAREILTEILESSDKEIWEPAFARSIQSLRNKNEMQKTWRAVLEAIMPVRGEKEKEDMDNMLIGFLKDKDRNIRLAAVFILQELKPVKADAKESLKKQIVQEEDAEVRGAMIEALHILSGDKQYGGNLKWIPVTKPSARDVKEIIDITPEQAALGMQKEQYCDAKGNLKNEFEYKGSFSLAKVQINSMFIYQSKITGEKILIKGGSEYTLQADYIGLRFFKLFGLPVPNASLVRIEGKLYLAIEYMEGYNEFKFSLPQNAMYDTRIMDGILLSIMLGDNDRKPGNILHKGSELVHIDFGASLFSRATGGFVPFTKHLNKEELQRVLNIVRLNQKTMANEAYGEAVKDRALLKGLAKKIGGITNAQIRAIVKSSGIEYGENSLEMVNTWIENIKAEEKEGRWNRKPRSRFREPIKMFEKIIREYGGLGEYIEQALIDRRNDIVKMFADVHKVDLHHHTTASDGLKSPGEVIKEAKEKGLLAIGITDHNTFGGWKEAIKKGDELGVEVVPGIEADAYNDELGIRNFHLLVYFPRPDVDDILTSDFPGVKMIKERFNADRKRDLKIIERFNNYYKGKGLEITETDVKKMPDIPNIYRIGMVLFEKYGAKKLGVENYQQVTKKYIRNNPNVYINPEDSFVNGKDGVPIEVVLDIAKKFGGVVVLAHPFEMLDIEKIKRLLSKYPEIQGIEVYSSKNTGEQVVELKKFISDSGRDYFVSIGSDSHNEKSRGVKMGAGRISGEYPEGNIPKEAAGYEVVEDLRSRFLNSNKSSENVTVIGTGYVGLVHGAVLADMGDNVVCADIDKEKINLLNSGQIPIYEDGLQNIVNNNVEAGKLRFSSNIDDAVRNSDIIFVAVGTPMKSSGEADLTYIKKAAERIGRSMDGYKLIIIKSTVPPLTYKLVRSIIEKELNKRGLNIDFSVASNPEFLREGSAVMDTQNPDRIVIGVEDEKVGNILKRLYRPWIEKGVPVLITDPVSAWFIKYGANTLLASEISFIGELAFLSEFLGGDITHIEEQMRFNHRIRKAFIRPGIGYGGSCFPKDVSALINIGEKNGIDMSVIKAAREFNHWIRVWFAEKIKKEMSGVKGKTIAVLGLAFKQKSDDVREAPSIDIIKYLVKNGAIVKVYDPEAMENAKKVLPQGVIYSDNPYECAKGTDAIVILTGWSEFKELDLTKLKEIVKNPVIFDGKNIFNSADMNNAGFRYISIGRPVSGKNHISSEVDKKLANYGINAFFAMQMAFIGQLSLLCRKLGGNIDDVVRGMNMDKRIGADSILREGIYFRGNWLLGAVERLIELGDKNGLDLRFIKTIRDFSNQRRIPHTLQMKYGRVYDSKMWRKYKDIGYAKKIYDSFQIISKIEKPTKISMIVPTYGGSRFFPKSDKNPYGEDALRIKIAQLEACRAVNPLFSWELIIVDDGSKGNKVGKSIEAFWKEIQNKYTTQGIMLNPEDVKVLYITPEQKKRIQSRKGGAVYKGMEYAVSETPKHNPADVVFFTDVDISADLRQVGLLLGPILFNGYGVSVGSRWMKNSIVEDVSFISTLSSRIYNLIVRLILPIAAISDTQRGFKAFRRDVVEHILPYLKDNGLSFDTELLLLSKLIGASIDEVPIAWFESQSNASTISLKKDAISMLKGIWRQRAHLKRPPKKADIESGGDINKGLTADLFLKAVQQAANEEKADIISALPGYSLPAAMPIAGIILKADKFPGGELRVFAEHPEKISGKKCVIFGNPRDSESILELLFSIELFRDSGAKKVVCCLPNDIPLPVRDIIGLLADNVYIAQESGEVNIYKPAKPLRSKKTGKLNYILSNYSNNGLANELTGPDIKETGVWKIIGTDVFLPDSIQAKNVLVVHSVRNNDELMDLFLVLHKLAMINPKGKVECIIPYLSYARQHKTYPVGKTGISANSAKAILLILNRLADRLVTVNVHFFDRSGTQYFPGVEDLPIDNLNAFTELARWYKQNAPGLINPVLIAPDKGASAYVKEAAEKMGWDYDYLEKRRISPVEVQIKVKNLDIKGRDVIILDDIIATGGTMIKAIHMLKNAGARRVFIAGVHGQFLKGLEGFNNADNIICTDTIKGEKNIVKLAPLLKRFLSNSDNFWQKNGSDTAVLKGRLYWEFLKGKNDAESKEIQKVMSERLNELSDLYDDVVKELKDKRDKGEISISEEQMAGINIFLYGSSLWHAGNGRAGDIDALVIIPGTDIRFRNLIKYKDNLKLDCVFFGEESISEEEKKAIFMESMISGVFVMGEGKFVKDTSVNLKDLLNHIDLLMGEAMSFSYGDFMDLRKAWGRAFESLLYLYIISKEYDSGSSALSDDIQDIIDSYFNGDLPAFYRNFFLGRLEKLPWESEDSSYEIREFRKDVQKVIDKYRRENTKHLDKEKENDNEWAVTVIEGFKGIFYMGKNSVFNLMLAQSSITPEWFKDSKQNNMWDKILEHIADSSFLDEWYLRKLKEEGKFNINERDLKRLLSIIDCEKKKIFANSDNADWLVKNYPELENKNLVYLSPEAKLIGGLKSLMSGGLGVLAGELIRGFGDIGVKTYGMTLFYKKALIQYIDDKGSQIIQEAAVDYSVLPVKDTEIIVDITIGDKAVKARVWELREGRSNVFLFDTDVDGNSDKDKRITETLYAGKAETPELRLKQNIVLGRGTIDFFKKLNLPIGFLHLNEAHTVIAAYDLAKERTNPLFKDAKIIFTTHTPVEAGLPKFDMHLAGLIDTDINSVKKIFFKGNRINLAYGALNLADMANGVSQEHREVTVKRWAQDYSDSLIGITNGVDVPYWQMPDIRDLSGIADIEKIIKAKQYAKNELLKEVENRTGIKLNSKVLTIVIARRITGYKHTIMILENIDRIKGIINAKGMPVQIIFAGNSHPSDIYGQDMIRRIKELSLKDGFKGKIAFVPNYNVDFAKLAVRGADIWISNPEPEEEACATSYAKALKNGTIIISTYTGGPMEHMDGLPLDFNLKDYKADDVIASGFFIYPGQYSAEALYKSVELAEKLYYLHPGIWHKMMGNALNSMVEVRDTAKEYVKREFLVSLLKGRFQKEVKISDMVPAPMQKITKYYGIDDFIDISVNVEFGSLNPDYADAYIHFGMAGRPDTWRDVKMERVKETDKKRRVYRYKGRIYLKDLTIGRYGFTTKVSLMGLPYGAYTKWNSWQGNDGIVSYEKADLKQAIDMFLNIDKNKDITMSGFNNLQEYISGMIIKNGRVEHDKAIEIYNLLKNYAVSNEWDKTIKGIPALAISMRPAVPISAGKNRALIDKIKSAIARNQEVILYLFLKHPEPCIYNYSMSVNAEGELELSEYNNRYRYIYKGADVIAKLKELGYIGGNGRIIIQPRYTFSATLVQPIAGASVFLHTHPMGTSTSPSSGDMKYWSEYSAYWFGKRMYKNIGAAVLSLYPPEINWVKEHTKRVSEMASIIADKMGYKSEFIDMVRIAALAHDLGKGYSPEMINAINSPLGKQDIIKSHPQKSIKMLERFGIEVNDVVKDAIRNHHTPQDAKTTKGKIIAQIIYSADIIDASQDIGRPYKSNIVKFDRLIAEFKTLYEQGHISQKLFDVISKIMRDKPKDFMAFIVKPKAGQKPENYPLIKASGSNKLLYKITIDASGNIVKTDVEKESPLYNEGYIIEALKALIGEYGFGILSGIKEINIVDANGSVGSQIDGKAVIDIDMLRDKNMVMQVLEHEAFHEILGLIAPDNPAIAEVLATLYSARRFLRFQPAERQNIIDLLKNHPEKFGVDNNYVKFLEGLSSYGETADMLIQDIIGYLRTETSAGEITAEDRIFKEALRLLTDISDAGGLANRAKNVEETAIKVIKTFNGIRIKGKRIPGMVRRVIGFTAGEINRINTTNIKDIKLRNESYVVVDKKRMNNDLKKLAEKFAKNKIRFVYDINRIPQSVPETNVLVLVDPEDTGEWKGRNRFYLPLPYMRLSFYLVAELLLFREGNNEKIETTYAYNFVKGFYKKLLGRELDNSEVLDLFHRPWWILPDINKIKNDFGLLRDGIRQLDEAA